jgi:serine/threonine-protein kinase
MSEITERLRTAIADRYVIDHELGAGGMATVYLAQDLKHDRKVAVKVLKPELAAVIGAERFLNEIKVTANLQHPHILPLHDSGEADSFLFYVMPYVEGETLRAKMDHDKQLGIDEALEITRSLAAALDYAHRHDVIHRDIKPENILLHDGQPLVVDFGIALAVSHAGGTRLTETGLSIGTPHYMSPEQAMGDRELDARSDVYSLGAMLYEMLTGDPPYTGSTAQAIVAKVITEKAPPVTVHRDTVPPHVAGAIDKALAKLPADRFHTAAEFADALTGKGVIIATVRSAADMKRDAVSAGPAWRRILPRAAAILAALAFGFAARGMLSTTAPVARPPVRFAVELPADVQLADAQLDVSPDGSKLVVPGFGDGGGRLYIHHMDQLGFTPIPGTEDGGTVFFSPDGEWVGFTQENVLKKVRLDDGTVLDITEATWGGGTWGTNDTLVYTRNYLSGLWRVAAGGGEGEELTTPDPAKGELGHWWPQLLPGEKHVLFTNFSTPIDRARIAVLSLESGEVTTLIEGGTFGRYLPTGHIAYLRAGTILTVPFDVDRLEVTGPPVPVLEQVAHVAPDGRAAFAVSGNGSMAYVPDTLFNPPRLLVWVDRAGREEPVMPERGIYSGPALSPDGRRIALTIYRETDDVWIYELRRGLLTRLTRQDASAFGPRWTRDGRRVIYHVEQPQFDLFWRVTDGSTAEQVLHSTASDKRATSISPDGTVLAFSESDPDSDIWLLPLDGGSEPTAFLSTPYNEGEAAFSPDGRWIAYSSDESGRSEIYVQAYPNPEGGRIHVSTEGGVEPRWTRGGAELVYRHRNRMLAAAIDPRSGEPGSPQVLFEGTYAWAGGNSHSYDVTPDGSRFLMAKTPPESAPRQAYVVLNWLEEMKRRVGQ